jgi:hypothetical protein
MKVRAEKDFWSGVMFLGFAAVAAFAARGYSMGAAGRMGPGYFPALLASTLALLAGILIVRSFIVDGPALAGFRYGPLAVIVLGLCLFGLTIERLGLVVSITLVSAVSALAARQSTWTEIAGIAAVLVVLSVAIFVYALHLPLQVWPSF